MTRDNASTNGFRNASHRLVVTAVRVSEQLTKAADRFLKQYKLTVAQFNFLLVLVPEPQGIPQSRIGERLVVSRANVTGLVRRLLARGLIRIESDASDSRLKKAVLTPAGLRLIRKIEDPYYAEIDRVTRGLRTSDLESSSELLDRIEENL